MAMHVSHGGLGSTLRLLRDGKPRTRAELAQLTGQTRAAVAQRVEQLMAARLIAPTGEAASTGGRPSATFSFNAAARVALAVHLGATHVHIAVTDLGATVLMEDRTPVTIDQGPEVVLERVATMGRELVAAAGRSPAEVVGIGVGLPGPVDYSTGRLAHPTFMPGWHDTDIGAQLQARLGAAPVLVESNVNLMALGAHATEFPDVTHLLFVKVGASISASLISDGNILRGAQGIAGNLGHLVVPGREALPCHCGNNGCLEAVASGHAVAAALSASGLEATSSDDVVALVRAGDLTAAAAVRDAGRALGEVLATCVSLLNPSVIVVGGALARAGEQLLAGLRETVYRRSLPLATQHLRIATSRNGDRAAVLGAATMVIEHAFSSEAIDVINI